MQPASMPAIPASALLSRLRQGDEEAWKRLMREYFPKLVRFAQGLGLRLPEAEDLGQEILLRLSNNVCKLESDLHVRLWLFRVANNLAIDGSRKNNPDLQWDISWLQEMPATGENPEDRVERDELDQTVRGCLEKLSPIHRAVVVLRYCEDFSYEMIAEALQIPLGTVASRLFHASGMLAKHLNRAGVEGARYVRRYNKKQGGQP